MRHAVAPLLAAIMASGLVPAQLRAQGHDHARTGAAPSLAGHAAFATIAEVVRRLEADAATDWSAVSIDRLREHLLDMDLVTLRASVAREDLGAGVRLTVRGDARTVQAARRMLRAHAPLLQRERGWTASVDDVGDAVRLTVSAPAGDARALARIRALGLAGLLATGDHHAAHHLAIARGGAAHAHE